MNVAKNVTLNLIQGLYRFRLGGRNDGDRKELINKPSPAFVVFANAQTQLLPLTKREGIKNHFLTSLPTNLLTFKPAFTLAEGATHVAMPPVFSKAGFTLAEVLITLGIIGVVVAMTIPGLMTAYRKHVVVTRLASFYSKINNTMRLSEEAENGDIASWKPVPSDIEGQKEWIRQYISPYLKCYEDTATYPGNLLITISDGTQFTISSIDWRFYPYGYKRKRNVGGKDFFYFEFNPNGCTSNGCKNLKGNYVMPYMYNYDKFTRDDMIRNCKGERLYGVGGNAYCVVLIQQNGWKIPSDYPLKL